MTRLEFEVARLMWVHGTRVGYATAVKEWVDI